jgi:hypothetical protein
LTGVAARRKVLAVSPARRLASPPAASSWAIATALLAVIAWAVVGCFDPTYERALCSLDGECPGRLVCVQDRCVDVAPPLVDAPMVEADAPAVDGSQPAGDPDGDGVLDPADNCAAAPNADQRDHDGDGRGDVCDGCPHVADAVADADSDGVGDACDPRPGAPDRIVVFDGFYDDRGETPAGWIAFGTAGAWRVRGGRLEQTATTRGAQVILFNQMLGIQSVDTKVQVQTFAEPAPATSNNRTVGAALGFVPRVEATAEKLWLCALTGDVTDGSQSAAPTLVELLGTTVVSAVMGASEPGYTAGALATVHATLESDGTRIVQRCAARIGSDAPALTNQGEGVPSGLAGLRTNGVAASFDYVVIYGS